MTLSTKLSDDITEAILIALTGDENAAICKRSDIVDDFISFYYDVIETFISVRKTLENDPDCNPDYVDLVNGAIVKIIKEFRGE